MPLKITAQLYNQAFNTVQVPLSNTSLTTAPYCSATPDNTQLTSIASNGAGSVFEVNSSGKLLMNRTADVAVFTRGVAFSPVPTTMIWKFDISVSGNSVDQTNAAKFLTGFGLGTVPFGEESDATNIRGRIGLNWTINDGEFSFRNAANTASSQNFTGEQTVVWVQNNSGAQVSYMAPDGSVSTVNAGFEDLWVGSTQVFNETPAVTSVRSLSTIKFILNSGSATVSLDNILVSPITPAPTASASQTVCGVVNPTLANLSATGTSLQWYASATGGTPLPLSTSITNGSTWYVSQTLNGIESVRRAVSVSSIILVSNNSIAADQIICTGTTPATLTGAVPDISGGTGSFSYAWEISSTSASSGFSAIGGATAQDLPFAATLAANRWYRRRVNADACVNFSNVVAVTITQPVSGNTVTAPSTTACSASPAATIIASNPTGGNGVFSYQWESSTVGSSGPFSTIPSSNTKDLVPGTLAQTTWFRRIVSSGACASSTSTAVQYNVNQPVINNDASASQVICTATAPALLSGSLPAGGNGTSYAYAWQSSSTLNGTYTSISGATAQNYQPPSLTATIFYRRQVSSGTCPATLSDTIQVTVNPVISNNTISPSTTQNVCSANIPPAFTGSTASGGNGSITYQWQSSTSGSSTGFSDIPGATSQSYSPGLLSQTTWFRRVVTAGICPASTTAAVQYTVTQPILNNDASGVQTICTGSIPALINGTLPTGGNGTSFTYAWQLATSLNGPYNAITTNGTLQNYQPPALTATTFYRRQVSSGTCPATLSDTIKVTVNPSISNNTISPNTTQNVCSANIPPAITGSTASGGNGSITYQWQSSTSGSSTGFSDIPGATSQSYSPGLLSQTTWFRRVVTAGICPASTTAAVQYSVTFPITNNDASASQIICTATAPALLNGSLPAGGNGTSYAYVWQSSSTLNGAYTNISGATAQNYQPPSLTATTFYRRQVSSGTCPATLSDTIQVTVNPVISNNTISPSTTQNVCSALPAPSFTGSAASGGNGSITYQWQSSTIGSSTGFSDIPGATSQSYSPGLLSQTTWFRRVVTAGICPASTTAAVQYTVTQPILNNDASGVQTICAGITPALINGVLPTGGNGTSYAYTWQFATALNGPYTSISGATFQNYQPPALTATTFYRRQVSSGTCPATLSDTIQVTVNPVISNNTISPNTTQNVCSALPAPPFTGSVASGGNGSITYQWQSSTSGSSTGFSDIPGATSQSYSPGLLSQTTWFRRVVTAGVCPASTTAAVQYTVTFPVTNNDATPVTSPICANTVPETIQGSLPVGGSGTYTYLWESTTTLPTATWSGANSAISNIQQNFSRGLGLGVNIWYRRRVTSGSCPATFSDTIAVLVNAAISGNSISAGSTTSTVSSTNVCSANIPPTAFGNVQTGGTGTYLYQWESSTTGSTTGFSPISGETNQSYVPGFLSQTTWFRRILSSGVCPSSNSNVLTYNVTQPILNNDASGGPQTICANTAPTLLAGSLPTGGNGTFTYNWQSSSTLNGTYNNVSSGAGQNYQPPTLAANTFFRRQVTSGFCPVTFSDTISIQVTPAIGSNSITGVPGTLCVNATPAAPFGGSLPTGGNGSYSFQWESSTVSATGPFQEIPGATNQTYSSGPLSVDTWFRRRVISGVCTSYSSVPKVTIVFPVINNDITASQTICPGTIPDTLRGSLPGGGTGTFVYQWQLSTVSSSGPFSSISGGSGRNYLPAAVSVPTWFVRRVSSASACPFSFSDTILIGVYPSISNNVVFGAQVVCDGNIPQPITGTVPSGGDGNFTYQWQVSTTGSAIGFSDVAGETGQGVISPVVTGDIWYRRIVFSGGCQSISNALQLSTSPNPTVSIGPAMADIVQGGISDPLGGGFGGSATGAVWTASEGTFFNNAGLFPDLATFKASLSSSPTVTLTITSTGGPCPAVSASKTINVSPDPFGITGVVNSYGQIIGPASLPVGALVCTLASGQGSRFASGDRALLIQMKGATVSLPSSPTSVTYGYLTSLGNSGNHEFLNIDSVAGDVIFFKRCIKKTYTISGAVQLVKVPVYNGNYNVKGSTTVSAIRLTRKGMGYPPNSVISTGITITPVQGGSGLELEARSDAFGQIYEVEILNPGVGYVLPPLITLPDPTMPPFDLPAYKAKAVAVMGLTAKQWNGRLGGIFCMEVNGNLVLNDSINMEGMGFSGGMIGDRGDAAPICGGSAEFALPFSSFERSGQKGEGIAVIPLNSERGRGRYGTGGGGGLEPEGGGGGGANWQDGGRGGASSYVAIPLSACSTTISPCDNDAERGGLGGGTNPSIPIGTKNVLRANAYYFTADKCRIYLGGGGGGGHAYNFSRGTQGGGGGGFGGGIIIIKGNNLRSNGMKIIANGAPGENANQDGAGGGGAGGAVLLDFETFTGPVFGRVNGGRGGNSIPLACDDPGDLSYPIRYRYSGAGGGGGGGVIWFSQSDEEVTVLASNSSLSQAAPGANDDLFNSFASQGGSARSQSELVFIENQPYLGSVFTVGGTSPKPDFPNLAKAAEFLALKGTDAQEITLRLWPNSSNASTIVAYKDPAVFKPIFTPGCVVGNATLRIVPNGGVNSFVFLQNYADDQVYLKADGIPKVTFEDLAITSSQPDFVTNLEVTNGSKMVFKNVRVNADVSAENAGNNEIELNNSIHAGSVTVKDNQTLRIEGSLVSMEGDTSVQRAITMGPGSRFYLGAGKTLDLNGVSWINDGADSVKIGTNAVLRLSGNFTNQVLGGTSISSFNKLDITSSGAISLAGTINIGNWNQTGSALVTNENNQILNVYDRITTGAGTFSSIGFGRVRLASDDATPVNVQGKFGNLEVNSDAGALINSKVEVFDNLLLSKGVISSDSLNANFIVQNPDPFSVVRLDPGCWVRGILQRRVQAGGLYEFPVGNRFRAETMNLNLNTLSGGLSRLNVQFVSKNPVSYPLESVVTPFQDNTIIFRDVLPGGYWKVKPDSGSANYAVWLYPKFFGDYPQYSIMKRPEASNVWNIYGDLENPDSTYSFIQSDSSVRRSNLNGFSDFAVAGGEDPLPIRFLDFRVQNRGGVPELSWLMADCAEGTRFNIWRGSNKSELQPTGTFLNSDARGCSRYYRLEDVNAGKPLRNLYYRIEATAPGELPAWSDVRSFSPVQAEKESASLAVIPEMSRHFLILGDEVDLTDVSLYALDGRLLAAGLHAENRLLNLQMFPKGLYIAEIVQDGVKIRQRIAIRE